MPTFVTPSTSYIGELTDWIEEEIEGAENYAEKYLEYKVKGNQWAGKFKQMAGDELQHAMVIHDLAKQEVEKVRAVYTPPEEMLEKWEKCHQKMAKKTEWVKEMLAK